MKSDLDRLMEVDNLDAIMVTGSGQHNPAMVYLTGGAHMTGVLVKKRNSAPILYCNTIEREEAASTGLETRLLDKFDFKKLFERSGGNLVQAQAMRYQLIFDDLGIENGRLSLYGVGESGPIYAILNELQALIPSITLVGEVDNPVLSQAMVTKDPLEIERIKRMGQITTQVIAETAQFLTGHRVKNDILVKSDGQPLTIGDVKRRIDLWLVERGAENPKGCIFAIGHDAGVPHNVGDPHDFLTLGQPIVFDIFPCEPGGGYYYDCTRTWSLGYASDEVMELYECVHDVYHKAQSSIKIGEHCPSYQDYVCDLFTQKGHTTIREAPDTQEGYVHTLGHGVGLQVHERPWFGFTASADEKITQGNVFTIEPGLYYPERNMGVRLENTVWITPQGTCETIVDYPMDLILPVNK